MKFSSLHMSNVCSGLPYFLLMLATWVLAGCASLTGPEEYPRNWVALDSSHMPDGCPNLSGIYGTSATDTFPEDVGDPPALGEIFDMLGRNNGLFSPKETTQVWPETKNADTAKFVQNPESLVISFVDKEQIATTLTFRRYHFNWFEKRYDDLFHCYPSDAGSRLRFFAEPEGPIYIRGIPYVFGEWKGALVFLLKALDGSLVVQYRTETAFMSGILLGTHVRFHSSWWRYPLLNTMK